MKATGKCACGRVLHYTDPDTRRQVEALIAKAGEHVFVNHASGRYRVQRHYLALHGIRGVDLLDLSERGIIERVRF